MKKILVLAGGFDQIALINELKKRDMYVVLADYFEDPPAKKYADKHFKISTLDEEAVYNLALSESVDIVTTACTDQALLTVARVSERLELPTYISAETAMSVTNKMYMKKRLIEKNIPTAQAIFFDSEYSWKENKYKLPDFPLVIKPCDCNSSKGVTVVNNYNELNSAVENAFLLSRCGSVIAEKFVDGREISIDVWAGKNGVEILSVSETEKLPDSENYFTIYKSVYPVADIEQYIDSIWFVVLSYTYTSSY